MAAFQLGGVLKFRFVYTTWKVDGTTPMYIGLSWPRKQIATELGSCANESNNMSTWTQEPHLVGYEKLTHPELPIFHPTNLIWKYLPGDRVVSLYHPYAFAVLVYIFLHDRHVQVTFFLQVNTGGQFV